MVHQVIQNKGYNNSLKPLIQIYFQLQDTLKSNISYGHCHPVTYILKNCCPASKKDNLKKYHFL